MKAIPYLEWEHEAAIYGLVDMESPERIRYVGLTYVHPQRRAQEHRSRGRRGGGASELEVWLSSVGDRLGYVVLDYVTESERPSPAEGEWYDRLRGEGHELLNSHAPFGSSEHLLPRRAHNPPYIIPAHTKAIVHCYVVEGMSVRAIADKYRFSRSKVQRHLRLAGVTMRPAGRPRASSS